MTKPSTVIPIVLPVLAAVLVGLALAPPARAADEDVLRRAMKDELARSLEKLRLEELEQPYFIAYRIDEVERRAASASLGSLLWSGEDHHRSLHVELRVGGYELDNTNFLTTPSFARSGMVRTFGGTTPLPLDDDYRELRRQIWLATDAAYKQALEDLAKKKAVLQGKTRSEELPDFSREDEVEVHDDRPAAAAELAEMEGLVTGISALFRQAPGVFTSRADTSASTTRTLYVNSEGTAYTRTLPRAQFTVVAGTQAVDGRPLEDFVAAYGRSLADLPRREELAQRVGELAERLSSLRNAELLDRYIGPVLFEGQAAAELFSQAFVPELIARRRPVVGDERMARFAEMGGGADFQDRLGARVLPRFLSITDDPTRAELGDAKLWAGYMVDDEGVPAGPTALIERGYLKTLLNGRAPVEGVEHSSGNHRAGAVMPSNLIVETDRGLGGEELRQEFLQLVADRGAEFGILVRRLGNPRLKATDDRLRAMRSFFGPEAQQVAVEPVAAAFKVYPDGREVLLRNLEISGLSPAAFKEIVAAGDEPEVVSLPYSPRVTNPFAFRGSGRREPPIVSLAVPPLLFEELTLKKPAGDTPKLPVAARPAFPEG